MAFLYPKNIEAKIGFDIIRTYLRDRCRSIMGISEVDAMNFSSDRRKIVEQLRQTSEMKAMYDRGDEQPEVSFNELDNWLPSLRIEGSYASSEQFLRLRQSLMSFDNVRNFFVRKGEKDEEGEQIYPSLSVLFSSIMVFPELYKAIDRVIDKSGLVKDSASPELADVRQKLSSMQGSITRAIQRIFSQAVKDGLTDKDSAPTMRDGRMVIPVPAANKRGLRGIIHDESATGRTIFIEPAETVELSNRMRELELEEQRIIVRTLTLLSDEIRPEIDSILESNRLLGTLDFIMAKARFAIDTGGELPIIGAKTEIDWYGAVHPVLLFNLKKQGKPIVPLNIRLDGKKRILVISGPNAGGKSVALKTVGLIQYMCQCGMLPTIHSNSHIGIFNKMFIDIGDEQSIENDLSTYSSHLKNMRQFLLHADAKSLILIDEIGSGTEPTIGAALAKSILMELAESHCFGVVTTHYHNLKQYAEESERLINGAMLYDRGRLQPTFQLSIGNPGSSFALEIAGKIGLPAKVIEEAKREVGEEYVESDRFLMEIARDRKYWQSKRDSIKNRESKISELERKYERLISELNQQKKDIIRGAQDEARQLLAGANKRIENTIQEIRKAEAEKEKTKTLRKKLDEFRQEVDEADTVVNEIRPSIQKKKEKKGTKGSLRVSQIPKHNPPRENKTEILQNGELKIGDYVKMSGSGTIGRILSISGKDAEVAFGNLRTAVKISKLSRASRPKDLLSSGAGYTLINGGGYDSSRERQLSFKDELDIRGSRAEEALDKVTHFIDDAIQFGVTKVRILHGTGSGILRQLVRQQLSATPGIMKFEDEDVRLGGSGITVVTIA